MGIGLSIILPSYNVAQYIERAVNGLLESVLGFMAENIREIELQTTIGK